MIDPLSMMAYLNTAMSAGGLISDIFGEDETENLLKERAKGIPPHILAEMRRRARSAIGNQGMAERVSTEQRLTRMNAPIAKRQEIADKIRTRQFGAIGDTLSDIDIANEQMKMDAIGQLAEYTERRDADKGMGFAGGLASSLGYLLNSGEELGRIGAKPNLPLKLPHRGSSFEWNYRPDFYRR